MRNFIYKIVLFCCVCSGVLFAKDSSRREYIIVGSKIKEVPSVSRKNGELSSKKTAYNGFDFSGDRVNSYRATSTSSTRFGGDDVESAMMQLQEQVLKLERKIEEQSKRITLVERQNALLLENNLKLKELVDKKLEVLAKSGKSFGKLSYDSKTVGSSTKNEGKDSVSGKISKEVIDDIRYQISENFCTKTIAKIDALLSKNPKKHVAELYFWRGMANYQKKSYLEATNDFVESYSRKPGKKISKFLLYFLSKALRKSGKNGDAKIIDGKISVDYPDFNTKKDYGVNDIK